MTEPIKSAYPVQTRILTPINEGSQFVSNSYIQFKINASELPMWLVNDSYLRFDIHYKRSKYNCGAGKAGGTTAINKTYIRNAANIFDLIKVKYGGDDIYVQTFNIEQNTLNMLGYGDGYLEREYATFTTTNTIKNGMALLEFNNGTATSATEDGEVAAEEYDIINVGIPINQLLPIFQDINSTGFPIGKLKRQIEINLYIAEPYKYLVDYDDAMEDFSIYFRRGKSSTDDGTDATRQPIINVPISDRYQSKSVELRNVRMYCSCYVPTNDEDGVITSKVNGSGIEYRYHLWHIGVREVTGINATNNLPFSVTTENTGALMLYCHDTKCSPSVMYRPNIQTLYLRFGEMQLPFQPISGDTWSTPFEYRFTSDDVLNNVDTYYSLTNWDYNKSYKHKDKPDTSTKVNDTAMQNNRIPGGTFVLMGANFTNSPNKLGSPSSRWNHQYQASFNALFPQTHNLRFILGVKTEYGLIVKNGDIAKLNI